MLKHAVTLGLFVIGDLMIVTGSTAVGSSITTSIIGLALFAIGFGAEVNAWRLVARTHGPHANRPFK